jgi:predicted NBD/HSP70 family sugar kinase
VRPRDAGAVVLAVAIAVDSLAVALVGLGGAPIARVRIPRPRGHLTLDAIVEDLRSLVGQLPIEEHRQEIIGIGVAMAGLVRRSDGSVSSAPNLGWRDAPLGSRIAAAVGLDVPVHVANEADVAAIAELRRGAARGADDLLLIWGEVGVGGGIIVDGVPLTGAAGYAGEVGHMPVNPAGATCGCGSVGCWETEIGERALLRLAGRSVDGGTEAVDAVLADARDGEPGALVALAHVGRWVGIGLAGLVNILNPRVVVLGGLFTRAYPYLEPAILAELDRLALRAPRELVRIAPATLGMDAPILGAAELALEPFLSDPAAWLAPRVPLASVAG